MIGRGVSNIVSPKTIMFRNVVGIVNQATRGQHRWLSLPAHKVVPMPSLSPTMESGSISKWNVKVGDRFEPGTSLCDVETDKATVSFDATDEGYLAKILVSTGEIKVGQPLLITVDEQSDVAAFENYQLSATTPSPTPSNAPKVESAPKQEAKNVTTTVTTATPSKVGQSGKIFASPLAKKLIRESNQSLDNIHKALGGAGSGPNGRIIASDVGKALAAQPAQAAVAAQPATSSVAASQPVVQTIPTFGGVYSDFEVSDIAKALIDRQTYSKQSVPHYHVSVEINMKELTKIRERLNSRKSSKAGQDSLGVLDFVVKAAAQSMQQVPDINASWMDTFVRRYEQVDINVVMGSGSQIATPVVKDVGGKGLTSIAQTLSKAEKVLFESNETEIKQFIQDESSCSLGTFSIYNLGLYGVKAAAPIVLTPQAAALSVGAITNTVVPAESGENGKNWEVAPIMVATLSCDHRVVDGATSAQWLAAFKLLLENPENLLL